MSATLKNVSNQPVVIVLDHPAFANKVNGWTRSTAKFAAVTEAGVRTVSEVRRSYAGSLTLLPGESKDGLHEAVVKCSQVPALLASKVLKVTYQLDEVQPNKGQLNKQPDMVPPPMRARRSES